MSVVKKANIIQIFSALPIPVFYVDEAPLSKDGREGRREARGWVFCEDPRAIACEQPVTCGIGILPMLHGLEAHATLRRCAPAIALANTLVHPLPWLVY